MLINNNCNVWQPPVAKHCPITPLLLTTTNPQSPTATVATAPRKCLHRPREGALIVNCCVCPSPHRGMWANNMPHHRPSTPHHCPSPPTASLAANRDLWTPHHHPKMTRTPRHSCQQPIPATSSPKTSTYATSRTTTTHTCHLSNTNHRVCHVTDKINGFEQDE